MNKKFKEGDWCFSDFHLCQIKRMENNEVIEVSDGAIIRSGRSLTDSCFPLDLNIKRCSDYVKYYYDKLHAIKGVNLNYPDIVRWLESKWAEMCNDKDNDVAIERLYNEVADFYKDVLEKVNKLRDVSVSGISLVRP